jgi:hypothetical protein
VTMRVTRDKKARSRLLECCGPHDSTDDTIAKAKKCEERAEETM